MKFDVITYCVLYAFAFAVSDVLQKTNYFLESLFLSPFADFIDLVFKLVAITNENLRISYTVHVLGATQCRLFASNFSRKTTWIYLCFVLCKK